MKIITLTTDFGEKDPYAGAVKGAIYSELETVRIVDISHTVSPFHINEAAYIIKGAYQNFPKGSIHIIGVDSERTPEVNHIAVKLDGHYFICANNGIISLITKDIVPEEMVEINIHDRTQVNFTVLDVFVQTACHIARGGTLGVVGKAIDSIKSLTGIQAIVNSTQKQIIGNVIYIDNYGNIISNVSKKLFDEIGKGRTFKIQARGIEILKIYKTYSEVVDFSQEQSTRRDEGRKLAIFNSEGYLELAIYKSNPETVGSAAQLFGLTYRDPITLTFVD